MTAKCQNVLIMALIVIISLPVLCGCRGITEDNKALIVANPKDYADSSQHDMTALDFTKPDVIAVVRDDKLLGEYAPGSSQYQELLELNTQALQNYIQKLKDTFGEGYSAELKGVIGSGYEETEDGWVSTMQGGVFLIYKYTNNAYAPIYFQIRNPAQDVSSVWACQPDSPVCGYGQTQELWDYLQSLKTEA